MKKFIIFAFFFFARILTAENESTIAILDVVPKYVEQAKADIIYEYILDRINRTGAYVIVERAALNKALAELEISFSDMVDETTAVKIGKLAGAQYVLISSLILESKVYYLSMRVVSIETGKITRTSVKSTTDFSQINELANSAVEYLLNTGKTATAGKEITDNADAKLPAQSPGMLSLRLITGGIFALPILDDAEILNPGLGGVLGLDFKLASSEIGDLFCGFKVSGIFNNTVVPVVYQYNLINIPVWLSVSYDFRMWKLLSLFLELDGGLAFNGFFYNNLYPDKTDKYVLKPGISPGVGAGFAFTKNISAALFCHFLMIFYETYPFTGLTLSLRLHTML